MSANSYYKKGQRFAQRGKYSEAIECFEKTLAGNPEHSDALFALGNVAKHIGLLDIAEKMYRATLMLLPDSIEAASNLGTTLTDLDRVDEAIAIFQNILSNHGEHASTWLNLGVAVKKAGDAEKAELFTQEALRLKPKNAEAHANLSELIADRGEIDAAFDEINKAWSIDKKNGKIRYNRAELMLLLGDLKNGWREIDIGKQRYEGRKTTYNHKLKRWNGESLAGKSILLSSEQGIADQIRFLNCVPDIIERAAHVIIEIEPRLVDLVARTFPDADVRPYDCTRTGGVWHFEYDWPVSKLDYASPMLNLFRFCRDEIDKFPVESVEFVTNTQQAIKWKKRVAEKGQNLKVGICWRGGRASLARSVNFSDIMEWGPVFALKGVTFFNLMYDECADERAAVKDKFGVDIVTFDDLDYMNDMEGIFALSAQMDVMVASFSAPSSITASLGVPTYMLIRNKPWDTLGTDIMPMTPSMMPITQDVKGDWSSAIARIANEIKKKYLA